MRLRQSTRQFEGAPQQGACFPVHPAAAGRVRNLLQISRRTGPIQAKLEMARELGRDFAGSLTIHVLQKVADVRVQPGPAAGRLATVQNITIDGMQEFVACRDAAVRESMYARGADD